MKWHLAACMLLMAPRMAVATEKLPDGLFGIALGSQIQSLAGLKGQSGGQMRSGGVVSEVYFLDPRIYAPPPPLTQVRVPVETATGRIRGVAGTAEMDGARCRELAQALRAKDEVRFGATFTVLQHQGDEFYVYKAAGKLLLIGCQHQPRGALLQYQLELLPD